MVQNQAGKTLLEKAICDPESVVGSPTELLKDNRFSTDEKRKLLESWRQDATALMEAENENMEATKKPTNVVALMEKINKALAELKRSST